MGVTIVIVFVMLEIAAEITFRELRFLRHFTHCYLPFVILFEEFIIFFKSFITLLYLFSLHLNNIRF